VCSDSGFLLKTSLLKACELRRITLMRSSPRSYRMRFRNSSGTAPEECRSAENHRPMLTALLALTTTLLFVVVVTLSTLLITLSPEATSSTSDAGNAAAPAMGGAVGSNFSYDTAVDRHAEVVAAQSGHFAP
jgi:hypothetical protein